MEMVVELAILVVVVLALLLTLVFVRNQRTRLRPTMPTHAGDSHVRSPTPFSLVTTQSDMPELATVQEQGTSPGPVIENVSLPEEKPIADERQRKSPQSRTWTADRGMTGDLIPLEPYHLDEIASVAQALDNQWEPVAMMRNMQRRGLGLADVSEERNQYVRGEYIRALVNSSQLVINRAFLYNSSAVSRDYVGKDADRPTFMDLLESGTIVPYLYNEQTPADPPRTGFGFDPVAYQAWTKICQESRVRCVRLSWDEATNDTATLAMASGFEQWCRGVHWGKDEVFAGYLAMNEGELQPFRRLLDQLATLPPGDPSRPLTRDDVYKALICHTDATRKITTANGYYHNEAGVAPLKQLVDLKYNTNLSDFMSRYTVTPIESPIRMALQEYLPGQAANVPEDATDLLQLLRQEVFAIAMDAEYLRSMDELSLADVKAIRRSPEWHRYRLSLLDLTRHPLEFGERSTVVHQHYVELAKVMTRVYEDRTKQKWLAAWQPRVHLLLTIGAGVVLMHFNPLAGTGVNSVVVNVIGDVGTNLVQKAIGRVIIGGAAHVAGQANLAMSLDFMNKRVVGGQEMFKELRAKLREKALENISEYTIIDEPQAVRSSEPTLTPRE